MKNDEKGIMEVKTFIDQEGREVKAFVPLNSNRPKFYHGKAAIIERVRMPNGQEAERQRIIEFPFPDDVGLTQVFAMFDETAKKFMDEWIAKQREEAAKNRVVAATAIPSPNLLGPDGKPVR